MKTAQVSAAFDHKERERVRRTLLRYMAEHTIGVPTLEARIIEADAPRHREIPRSTLQRFLGGSRRTNDHHVALCHRFASQLPYFEEGRDNEQFGEALFEFLQGQAQGREREALIERLAGLAGTYEAAEESLTLDAADGQPYLYARATGPCVLATDAASEGISDELAARRRVYEGVLVLTSSGINMFLRHSLTRSPKLCCLFHHVRGEYQGALAGQTFEWGFAMGIKNNQRPVHYVPVAAREKI